MNAPSPPPPPRAVRVDLAAVAAIVTPGSRVLDVGCGDGALLQWLAETRQVDGRGVELSQRGVNDCVAKGLSVIQGDADTDLADYPTDGFDYVILSQTLQATRRPRDVLVNMLRIGRRAIVSFPNFGHWRVRLSLLLGGRMPLTPTLTENWYETQNIHLCTIKDFVELVADIGAHIERGVALDHSGRPIRVHAPWWVWNLLGAQAIFLLERNEGKNISPPP
ncbi:methionine biosynthesis protein MetW [Methylosinus sp. Sm6]|uniref:methionine biosynthesis protein MetW n=1 Tax=Methylosinus sp. Sm6 TaxID=2866948 RepID=UPI001C996CC9|nr:methionine biosynthesis protein MetW [Methylosinus sp. Sm6]MBY6242790.1 methionine biosynthesis protein MetW [Methylosinus sp. Sm6]